MIKKLLVDGLCAATVLAGGNLSGELQTASKVLPNISHQVNQNVSGTHFIAQGKGRVAAKKKEVSAQVDANDPYGLMQDGHINRAFFAPDDDVKGLLLDLIKKEKQTIQAAIFNFTEKDLAQALIDAHARGVRVEVVLDPGCANAGYSKIAMLRENGIDVYVYDPEYKKAKAARQHNKLFASIMHHKYVIFHDTLNNKAVVISGSLNWTASAHTKNQESVKVEDDPQVVEQFMRNFRLLKEDRSSKKRALKVARSKKTPPQLVAIS